jgi:hypothetical protein
MKQLTKAQITIGILSYFSIIWALIENLTRSSFIIVNAVGFALIALAVMLVLSVIILSILEWIKIFDLKTNAVITLVTLMSFGISLLIITIPK